MGKGQTYLSDIDESKHRHLRIVISDADDYNNYLTVPLVSVDESKRFQDKTCIIEKGEHPFIKHQSCIEYRKAEIISFAKMYNGLRIGLFIRKEDVSPDLLQRIQDGARTTKHLPNKFKVFFSLF